MSGIDSFHANTAAVAACPDIKNEVENTIGGGMALAYGSNLSTNTAFISGENCWDDNARSSRNLSPIPAKNISLEDERTAKNNEKNNGLTLASNNSVIVLVYEKLLTLTLTIFFFADAINDSAREAAEEAAIVLADEINYSSKEAAEAAASAPATPIKNTIELPRVAKRKHYSSSDSRRAVNGVKSAAKSLKM